MAPVASDPLVSLYEEHAARLRGLAAAITFDSLTADEIVHDAYAGLIARRSDVREPVAYLHRSVINLAINTVRRRQRFRQLPQRRGRNTELPPTDETWALIGTLSPRQRAVIVLRFYEDRSHDQIAEILGVPVGTVKSTLHRALSKLKEQMT